MANAEKVSAVSAIAESFRGSSAAVLTEYRGLTVAELTELRRALGDGVDYAVVKNTLTRIAARDAGLEGLDALLTGPTAVAFVSGDPVEAAKGLRDFARTHPLLVVKGGVMEGRALNADEVRRLADLESREVLLARLAGAMLGSLSQAVGLFAAPLAQVARLVEALRQKAETDPGILRGADLEDAAAPAAESAPAAEPAAEVESAPEVAPGDAAAAGQAPGGDEPATAGASAGGAAGGDPAPETPGEGQPLAGSDPTATGQVPTADTGDPDGPSETPVVAEA